MHRWFLILTSSDKLRMLVFKNARFDVHITFGH